MQLIITEATKRLYDTTGHILEFWVKMDNNCPVPATGKYYIFWSIPHTIYVESATYKYEIWNSLNNNGSLTGFKQYEWNRIMFKVVVNSGTTSVCVFVNNNFDVPEFPSSFPCKPVTDNMILQRIAFCFYNTNNNKKNCQAIGKDIEFASAYYKNIRVWEVSSAPEIVALAYHHSNDVQ